MRSKRPAVIDMSLIVTLAGVDALDLCLARSRYDWHITPIVRREATHRGTRDVIDRAITANYLRLAEIDTTDQSQMDLWIRWEQLVDAGEAEAITVALVRRWLVGLEDRQAQRALDREVGSGHWVNAVNLLLDAVADGVLRLPEADELFVALDSYAGYRKRGVASLADLVR